METKKDKLREKINEFILNNNNSHLTEEILCKKFKVSRTPVREVLKYLEQDGFIQTQRKKGITFKHFTVKEIEDIYQVRLALEELAVEKAVKNINDGAIKKLKKYAKMYRQAREKEDEILWEKADKLFHETIIELSGNWYLLFLIKKIRMFDTVFRLGIKGNGRYITKTDLNPNTHYKIIKALATRDTEKAKEILRNHILWGIERLLKRHK